MEQTVEFTISLVDPGYRELLDDADSPQYHDLSRHLQEQVRIRLGLMETAMAMHLFLFANKANEKNSN